MIYDDAHVKIHGCFIVWNGITEPEVKDGKTKYSLKVVVPTTCGDLNDLHNLAQSTLQSCPFKGILPQGADMPIGWVPVGEQKYNGLYDGWVVLNCNTQRLPKVYDEVGKLLDPMQYGPAVWGGQAVDVLVHCYHYDKAGNKGIATGLDAFSIILSRNAVQQNFGGAGVDAVAAFGQQTQQTQGGFTQQAPQQQQGGFAPQQQQGGFAPQQQAPAQQGGFAPQQQAPAQQGGFAPQQQAPANNGQVYQDPSQQAQSPQQASGFLPEGQQQQAPAQQGGFAPQQQAPAQQGGFAPQQQQGGFAPQQ